MHKGVIVKTLLYIKNNNLSDSFCESIKLLETLITIPMCSTEAERTFSSLKRIKTYLRNTMGQSRPGFPKVGQVAPLGAIWGSQGAISRKGAKGGAMTRKGAIREPFQFLAVFENYVNFCNSNFRILVFGPGFRFKIHFV